MERNIAALLREDARTVHVVFDLSEFAVEGYPHVEEDGADVFTPAPPSPRYKVTPSGIKTYTYVTDLPLRKGDVVVVQAKGVMTLACVARVDDEVKIEPASTTRYQWVVSVVDVAAYERTMARNREIETAVNNSYRANLRRGFAQQVLAGVDDETRNRLAGLIAAPQNLG